MGKAWDFPKKSTPDIAFFTLNGTWLVLYNKNAFANDELMPAEQALGNLPYNASQNRERGG
tara:strand:+ start:77 stop:259 length:183 start_codon:yes stop_codon:yes gene_type:complete